MGDWTGLIAILAIASKVSTAGTGIALVMVARMLPGFVLAPIAGVFIDRWNRKTVMVGCDIGRAGLLLVLPFWDNLLGLVVISFLIEVLTLMWGPAKDATVPNVVKDPDQLASANSLGLIAAYGTFPLGAVFFAILAGISKWLGDINYLGRFHQANLLPLWVDALTFLVSALLISRLRPRRTRTRGHQAGVRFADVDRHRRWAQLRAVESAGARRDGRARGRPPRLRHAHSTRGAVRNRCSRRRSVGLRAPVLRARSRRRDRSGHALVVATSFAAGGGVHDCGCDHGFGPRRGGRGVVVDARDLSHRPGRRGRGLRVRDRVHGAARAGRRRHARSHVRDAVHRRARVPAACPRARSTGCQRVGFHCERDGQRIGVVRNRALEPARRALGAVARGSHHDPLGDRGRAGGCGWPARPTRRAA